MPGCGSTCLDAGRAPLLSCYRNAARPCRGRKLAVVARQQSNPADQPRSIHDNWSSPLRALARTGFSSSFVVCSGLNAAAASTGGGGAGNHGHWDGGSGGSGGDGPSSGPGGRCPDNVLGDIASNESADKLEDVILLDVSGMKCGGCVSHVKDLLEQHPDVISATVNLATETALVKVRCSPGGGGTAALAQQLAEVLSSNGFPAATATASAGRGSMKAACCGSA